MTVEEYLLARFLASKHAEDPAIVAVHVRNLDLPPHFYPTTAEEASLGTAGAQGTTERGE